MTNQNNNLTTTATAIKIQEVNGKISELKIDQLQQTLLQANQQLTDPIDEQSIKDLVDEILTQLPFFDDSSVSRQAVNETILAVLKERHDLKLVNAVDDLLMAKQVDASQATDISFMIQRLLDKDASIVNENANKDSQVFNTQRDLTAGTVAKAIGLKMLPPKVAAAHLSGDIHWHDLDYQPYSPMTNCCLIDFKEMLTNGFKIGNAEVESPNSIGTATAQMAQIIANVASSQYGGCSADRTDELLAPFAEKKL